MEKFLAKTFAGLEEILSEELLSLGAQNCCILNRAVQFEGDLNLLYRANYYSRISLRIFLQIKEFTFEDNDSFYKEIRSVEAEKYLKSDGTLAISATTHNSIFSTPLFASVLAKDAICDRFRDLYKERPSVDKESPDVQFHLHIFGQNAILYLDSSGESLHKRGYKVSTHPAPINEVVAAAILKLTEWKKDCDVIDFMCGSGTLLIEAAMAGLNIPAGFYRSHYGFFSWLTFDHELWKKTKDDAVIEEDIPIDFYGSDISGRYLGMAKANIVEARLSDFIHLKKIDMSLSKPHRTPALVVINPPYGERLELVNPSLFYKEIGDTLKKNYAGCTAWIISSDFEALKHIGLRATRKFSLYNGPLACKLLKFELYQGKKQ